MTWPFRTAAVLLVLFCVAHTAGGMLSGTSFGPESDAVLTQMQRTHFDFNGADATWFGFWFGFGLTVTLFLLLGAVLAWSLGSVSDGAGREVRLLGWALALAMALNAVLAWRYFFIGPVVFSVLITALLVVGLVTRNRRAATPA